LIIYTIYVDALAPLKAQIGWLSGIFICAQFFRKYYSKFLSSEILYGDNRWLHVLFWRRVWRMKHNVYYSRAWAKAYSNAEHNGITLTSC